MALGRNQVKTAIDQNITDPLQNQNTAAVVRAVLKQITDNFFNLVDDELSISKVKDLQTKLNSLEQLALNAEESDVITTINAEITEIQTFLESFTGDKFEAGYLAPSTLQHLAKNTNIGEKTAVEVLKLIMTPPFAPAVPFINSINPVEKGANNAINISGGITLNDEPASGVTNRRIEKDGVLWRNPAANAIAEADSISITTTYAYKADVTNGGLPDSTVSASRTVSAFAPSYYLSTGAAAITEAIAKAGTKQIWGSQASRAITFFNNNQRVAFVEPQSNGIRTRIMDQNGFNVTTAFTRTSATFTLADGSTSEEMYIYLLNDPAGNGAAFTYTFFNS